MNYLTYTGELEKMQCWCGIHFAVPVIIYSRYRDRKQETIYCPLGHGCMPGKNEIKKLKAQIASLREREEHLRNCVQSEQNSNRALRGHLTRTKKRIQHGVCPCCNRTFKNLARHMGTKHPTYELDNDHTPTRRRQ